jgi:hypothetical protein
MADFLGYTNTKLLFEKNWVKLAQGQNGIPVPRIKFRQKPVPFCPFLINEQTDDDHWIGLCTLHPHHKPLICALSPLGIETDFSMGITSYSFMKPDPDCPGILHDEDGYLYDMLNDYHPEIQYHTRYLDILDHLVAMRFKDESVIMNINCFDVHADFDNTLQTIEQQFFKAPHSVGTEGK